VRMQASHDLREAAIKAKQLNLQPYNYKEAI
jgi:hypothetical protein